MIALFIINIILYPQYLSFRQTMGYMYIVVCEHMHTLREICLKLNKIFLEPDNVVYIRHKHQAAVLFFFSKGNNKGYMPLATI